MTLRGFPDREAIRRSQLTALRRLLGAVRASNPFYGPVLAAAGLDEQLPDLETFIARMPLTEKAAIAEDQRRDPPFGTNLTSAVDAYSRYYQTSATSGLPIRWLDTPESWQWMLDNWKQVFHAAGVGPQDRLYFAFSFGPFLGFWTAFDAATQLGCLCIPGGGLSSAARLETLCETGATVLLCTPTYAIRLAEVAREQGIDLAASAVRTVLVAGEPGGSVPAVRRCIEQGWPGARVFDHHGMTEVGPVSYECPEAPGTLLVMEGAYLAEIIDPQTARPAPAGEVGELVLTTLGRLGSPLLRYRTGDLVCADPEIARAHGRCELALRGGILGRADDMVFVRGVNVYPAAVDEVLRSVPGWAEYRVELSARGPMTEMQIEVEPVAGHPDAPALAERIQATMRDRFHLRVPVRLCPPGTLPRFEMKARRWTRR